MLVPTRELAMQVNDALEPFAHAMQVSLRLVAGGLSMSKQVRALERGVHLLVATPGRLADLVRRGHADLSRTELVILDEADHMADMGFMDEIEEILAGVPAGGQRLLFSATLDGDVDRLISAYMEDPVLHDVTSGDDAPATLDHVVLNVPPHVKYQIATRIVARQGRTIVFVRSKLACDRIAQEMRDAGVLAVSLHGDKSQHDRNFAITGFRAGQIPVLVATDVAARGIHVDHVDLVLQMDPPQTHKDYTHRSGRTARAGEHGLVVTLVLPHQRKAMDRIVEDSGVDATFRKVRGEDEESLSLVRDLTGAQEPSGVPVDEPRPSRARGEWGSDRGGSRGGGRSGRQDRGSRGNGGPRDRGARDRGDSRDRFERPARGETGRRPTNSRAAYNGGHTPQPGHAKTRAELDAREQALAARERELELREQYYADNSRDGSRRSGSRSSDSWKRDDRGDRGGRGGRREGRPARRDDRRDNRRDDRRDDRRGPSDRDPGQRRREDAQEQRSAGGKDRRASGSGKGKAKGKKKDVAKPKNRSGKPRPKKKR